jgi:hypothetical protein
MALICDAGSPDAKEVRMSPIAVVILAVVLFGIAMFLLRRYMSR